MGFLDRLLGRDDQAGQRPQYARQGSQPAPRRSDDEIAIERYRYLLRTAPPEQLEQVHAEAFARLTPDQRRQVYADIAANGEQPRSEDPRDLARSATRAEVQQPGFMERSFGGQQSRRQGPGFGSMLGASILGTVAGYVIGSALMSAFLTPLDGGSATAGSDAADTEAADTQDAAADAGADTELASGDLGADAGGFDFGGFGDF